MYSYCSSVAWQRHAAPLPQKREFFFSDPMYFINDDKLFAITDRTSHLICSWFINVCRLVQWRNIKQFHVWLKFLYISVTVMTKKIIFRRQHNKVAFIMTTCCNYCEGGAEFCVLCLKFVAQCVNLDVAN